MDKSKENEKKRKYYEQATLSIQRFNRQRHHELTPFQRMFSSPIPPPPQLSISELTTLYPPPSSSSSPLQPPPLPCEENGDTIPTPFVWATNRRATVHSFRYLLQNQIFKITGELQCKRCNKRFEMTIDVREKCPEILNYFASHRHSMHDRAPDDWMNPLLPKCKYCNEENSVKPVIAEKKKAINWLFLLLGQMLGCCTLEQLKYFCKHTGNHRTGAKNRVLYLTCLGLCKQLDPNGPFNP